MHTYSIVDERLVPLFEIASDQRSCGICPLRRA